MEQNNKEFQKISEIEIVQKAYEKAIELINNYDMVELILEQALKVEPNNRHILEFLGFFYSKHNKFKKSIEKQEQLLNLIEDNKDNALNNLALAYSSDEQYDKATELLEQAISINPQAPYFNNLSLQYRAKKDYEKSIKYLEKALDLQPNSSDVYANLGSIYGEMKDYKKSINYFNKCLAINPKFHQAKTNKAYSYFLSGDFKKGFENYESRHIDNHQYKYYNEKYDINKKWQGIDKQSVKDSTFIIYSEQALGDAIMFLRYVKYLKQLGVKKVIFHCTPILNSVAERIEGVDAIFNGTSFAQDVNEEVPEHDFHCCSMSLPHLLKKYELDGKPYLQAPMNYTFPEEYQKYFKIGIAWSGSPAHPKDRTRSIHLNKFKKIHDIPNVKLFSFQTDYRDKKYKDGTVVSFNDDVKDMSVVVMDSIIKTFADTMVLLTGVDLVISVDTSLIHLAGAMGVPTWMMINHNPDWRWTGGTSDTTGWYDSVKIYRQTEPDLWDSVIDQVSFDLNNLVNK